MKKVSERKEERRTILATSDIPKCFLCGTTKPKSGFREFKNSEGKIFMYECIGKCNFSQGLTRREKKKRR